MDFFQSQEVARRRSKILFLYLALAVVGMVLSIYAVIVVADLVASNSSRSQGGRPRGITIWWRPELLIWTGVGTLSVILLGTGYKMMQLRTGGSVVARDLGGRRLDPNSRDLDERKLVNVVEEMSIAAGVPVPEIFLLEGENSINAFAAGRTPSDAVIGVTRGGVKLLTREELQAVIAHEFSHILNGDMRLNLRLLGLLHGIVLLAIIGRIIIRGGAETGEKAAFPIMAFGASLFAIGSLGLFFGKLIKAAVSRQREYLADASAVQFTRNPGGLGGALEKIGGVVYGSQLRNPHAEEASHMFFANGIKAGFSTAFATHPPLSDRIRKINPSWDGTFPPVELPRISAGWDAERGAGEDRRQTAALGPLPHRGLIMELLGAAAIESIGQLSSEQVEEGQRIHNQIPANWMEALRHPSGAQAFVFALLLAQDDELRSQEAACLEQASDSVTLRETLRLHSQIGDLHSSRKLALIDLAIPTLRRLSKDEYERFLFIMRQMMASDRQIDLFEFTLQKMVRRRLDLYFQRERPAKISIRQLSQAIEEISVLLSTLAYLGHPSDMAAAEHAFRTGAGELESELRGGARLELKPFEACTLDSIDAALNRFDGATPPLKKQLLYACGNAAMADGMIQGDEAELLRAIADTIGCPIPPFVRMGEGLAEVAGSNRCLENE